jgi:hypothetical protein
MDTATNVNSVGLLTTDNTFEPIKLDSEKEPKTTDKSTKKRYHIKIKDGGKKMLKFSSLKNMNTA